MIEIGEVVPKRDKPLRQLNAMANRPPLDIEFQDLVYSIRDGHAKGGWRQILKSVNGTFRSGELTAIMGPSGAGKSTLLNILAGYTSVGMQGSIKVNGEPRDMKVFNKLSSYIMQEDLIQPHLSVTEALGFAAGLKLGSHISPSEKKAVVDEVITLLGLEKCRETRSEHLSGGQRKRVSIALELVNNPPVIFLDEPTTGLDNFAINQCIGLLQKISKLGRTVICTIHQPPASLFHRFDQVYIVANGCCAYNGSPSQLIPFMSEVGFECPQNYTPADYIIEVVHSDPMTVSSFAQTIQNGRVNLREGLAKRVSDEYDGVAEEIIIRKSDTVYASSFRTQFWLLLSRMFMQMRRDRIGLYIYFFHHVLSGVLIGGIFYGIGNNGSQTIALFKYCVTCCVFFLYTYVMLPVLLFPFQMELLKREYFNRWYGLKPYYLALTISSLPMLMTLGTIFSTIVYFMTDQPLETHRFVGFCVMGFVLGLTSQGLGYAIGSIFSITNGSVVAPSVLAPLFALAIYGMGYRSTIEPFMKFLMTLSFLRHSVGGYCNILFYERAPLECKEIYCHYAHPETMMKDMDLTLMDYRIQIGFVFCFMVLFRVISYLSIKCRLNSEFSSKIVYLANKVINHKF